MIEKKFSKFEVVALLSKVLEEGYSSSNFENGYCNMQNKLIKTISEVQK